MTVEEFLKTFVDLTKDDTTLAKRNIETVIDAKKHFIVGYNNNDKNLNLIVSRKNYQTFGRQEMMRALESANQSHQIQLMNADAGNKAQPVTTIHLAPTTLEISAD